MHALIPTSSSDTCRPIFWAGPEDYLLAPRIRSIPTPMVLSVAVRQSSPLLASWWMFGGILPQRYSSLVWSGRDSYGSKCFATWPVGHCITQTPAKKPKSGWKILYLPVAVYWVTNLSVLSWVVWTLQLFNYYYYVTIAVFSWNFGYHWSQSPAAWFSLAYYVLAQK